MSALLEAVGYGNWVLHALMVLPLVGAAAVFLGGAERAKWTGMTSKNRRATGTS